MDNSIYAALSRQLNVFRDMDVTANNIANTNTVGFHSEHVMFTQYLADQGKQEPKLALSQDISSYVNTQDGPLRVTENPFDVAISGPGFFAIETAAGVRYTRAGNFTLGNDGTLMTPAGNPVLDEGGQPIQFNNTDSQIKIGENGIISALDPVGNIGQRGQLGIFEFEDLQQLNRLNNQLYAPAEGQQPVPAVNSRVVQGALEDSNVSAVKELVKTMELSRSTSSTAKFIEVVYDLQRKTSNAYAQPSQG